MPKRLKHPTLAAFAKRYLAEVVARDRKDLRPVKRYLDRDVLPRVGRKRVDRVTGADVQRLVFAKRDQGRPAAARALRGVLKRLFDYAAVCGAADANPAAAAPVRYLGRIRSRDRVLSEAELRALLEALRRDPCRGAWAIELLLLTMVRKGTLRLAAWAEIEGAEWTIPAERTKEGRAHTVYLPARAVELFGLLRKGQRADVERVLAMRNGVWEPASAAWLNQVARRYEKRARVKHFTVHDLRRTAATHLTERGWKAEVVEKALGHQIRGVRGVYNRAEFAVERRKMLEEWASWLEGLT